MVLQREVKFLQRMAHPNIIKLLHVFADHSHTYLVFEFMPCDLITFYKDISKKQLRCLTHS